ncbi:YcfL family protein [Vibrio sp. SS-MA-C1-2]|uniref:YcfL family protein n=1 Tax=Vibrio sp. SS-MA-C1-2 TaxID=2908646 RepID=UPI001F16B75A|nr:DUF1425 domain-containing protein [Vibrio sp. SS-MA-C1-2]UJF17416.1 YcfL family protein [Vibrio sp. SS-MA-C1-2]
MRILLFSLILLLTACSSSEQNLTLTQSEHEVVIADADLGSTLKWGTISRDHKDQQLQITIPFTNLDTKAERVAYRFYWYDDQGLEVHAVGTVWQTVTLEPKETVTISDISPKQVTSFRIYLRHASTSGSPLSNDLNSDDSSIKVQGH